MTAEEKTDRQRDAVKQVARDLHESTRGRVPLADCERRVSEARERGDRKRENGNR